jgi:hypothetical protein
MFARESNGTEDSGITNSGVIRISGHTSVGIYGGAVANVVNNGIIELSRENSKAIETDISSAETSQTISNNNALTLFNGNDGYGIYARGAVNINNASDGRITIGSGTTKYIRCVRDLAYRKQRHPLRLDRYPLVSK